MQEGTLSSYGGSAQQAADSRRSYKFLHQCGQLHVRHKRGKVILSLHRPGIPQKGATDDDPSAT
jgi:hypothetical protein